VKTIQEIINEIAKSEKPLIKSERINSYNSMMEEGHFNDPDKLRILMLGRFKAGKSSLVNALIGADLAAVDALEKTAWIARYWPSDEEYCSIEFKNKRTEQIDIEEFLQKTKDGTYSDEYLRTIHRIDVGYKTGSKYVIIDTPGFGSTNEDNEARAMESVKDADIVLYVVDINKLGNQREGAIISSIRESGIPMLCVANKYDGDVAHHKTYEEAVTMVADNTGFAESDIFLTSTKLYNKKNEKGIKYHSNLCERIDSCSIRNTELRAKARAASVKRANQEGVKALMEAKNNLLLLEKSRVQIEETASYNQQLITTELDGFIKNYVRTTLFDGYRDQIVSAMEAERARAAEQNTKPDLSKAFKSVLPDKYMDQYWEKVKKEITRKSTELWDRQEEEARLGAELLGKTGDDGRVDFTVDKIEFDNANEYEYNAMLSEKVINSTFTTAGFATFFSALVGASFGGALLIGIPILLFGMKLAESIKTKGGALSMEEILQSSIGKFADTASDFAVKNLSDNMSAILKKRLEKYDEDIRARIPDGIASADFIRTIDSLVQQNQADMEAGDAEFEMFNMSSKKLEKDIKDIKSEAASKKESRTDESTPLGKLQAMIGLLSVKENINGIISSVKLGKMKEKAGIKVNVPSRHLIFTGNPGTGKTEVARIVGEIYKELGILRTGVFIEASRKDLVAEYVGQTAAKTEAVLNSAKGGILFIDEAYMLVAGGNGDGGGNDFGQEAIDTILKFMEDNRDDIVVIAAGYSKEMEKFLDSNPGLRSRFTTVIDFPDYNPEELTRIYKKFCDSNGYTLGKEAMEKVKIHFADVYARRADDFANAREVRNFYEKTISRQEVRLAQMSGPSNADMVRILPEDLPIEGSGPKVDYTDYMKQLDDMVGLESVKKQIHEMISYNKVRKLREEKGLSESSVSMHMVFTGNPGTGKTVTARLLAKIYHQMGIIKSDRFVETSRADLVASYVGQTAEKTLKVCKSALGGVLFIDEAYMLTGGSGMMGGNDFGQESVDTLLKFMEDNRNNIVVIVAGYTNEMEAFLESNPGLRSRFTNVIEFPDYSPDEMMLIFTKFCRDNSYIANAACMAKVRKALEEMYMFRTDNFANARAVRNLFEMVTRNQNTRVAQLANASEEDLIMLTEDDVR